MTVIHGTVALATNLAAAWWQPVAVVSLVVVGGRWAWRRACRWADETLADVPWIVEEPLTLIRDDDQILDDLETDLACDADFRLNIQRIEQAINIPRPRREGEIG